MHRSHVDVAIIGAGAAGLFAAGLLTQAGLSVVVFEHNNSPGKKIRISGGGRCNFTNVNVGPQHFLSENVHFTRSALARYTPADFIAMVDRYGIAWHEKTLGQLFCDGSAQQIIDMLMREIAVGDQGSGRTMPTVQLGTSVKTVSKGDRFWLDTSQGAFESHHLVVATGGLSIPTLGASDLGYRIARQFGVPVVQTEPALVPVVMDRSWSDSWGKLSGVSLMVDAAANGPAFRESLLITHRGMSGPSILQASSYWHVGSDISIDALPMFAVDDLAETLRGDRRLLRNALSDMLPSRFMDGWADDRLDRRAADLKKEELLDVVKRLKEWLVRPTGTEGYAKAEVTRGGVDTRALSSKSMESSTIPGLYFIGEVVDVTGWLGGYNFQWAWSSAFACATGIIHTTRNGSPPTSVT